MFCVVYEFLIRENQNDTFEKAWSDYTDVIYRVRGSLGSRLHQTNDPQKYVAYAQRPSEEIFNDKLSEEKYSPQELDARGRMVRSILESKTVYKMNLTADLLRRASPAQEST